MRLLVIGGTHFVGRYLVAAAIEAGHDVTVLHRGGTCAGAPGAEHLHADRDGDLGVLQGRTWDATVDVCAYWPQQVRSLAAALGPRGGRHLLISTISVYSDPSEPGLDEQAPLLAPLGLDGERPPITGDTYGALKAGCEHLALQFYGGELLIVRPTYVVGPHDPTARFPYWVHRLAAGGRVLCPGDPQAPIQYIDVRDLGSFATRLLSSGDEGTFHAMTPDPPYSFADLLAETASAVAAAGTDLVWVDSSWLAEQGVSPQHLPLWGGSDEPAFALAMDPAAARSAGLHARALADTAADTLAWCQEMSSGWDAGAHHLQGDRERALLAQWDQRTV